MVRDTRRKKPSRGTRKDTLPRSISNSSIQLPPNRRSNLLIIPSETTTRKLNISQTSTIKTTAQILLPRGPSQRTATMLRRRTDGIKVTHNQPRRVTKLITTSNQISPEVPPSLIVALTINHRNHTTPTRRNIRNTTMDSLRRSTNNSYINIQRIPTNPNTAKRRNTRVTVKLPRMVNSTRYTKKVTIANLCLNQTTQRKLLLMKKPSNFSLLHRIIKTPNVPTPKNH